ncbi:hypothetical protein [Microvirga makkahensis]|uniref:Uncharacterized protein n=1 Tax=Microvirga makkahensis TaxID=1128670 RepID=A0A7X3MP12_9HYPH|nr:hypothetical protein [Microvirga makkahensis]MXQ10584.1 hypothetical protein [Microvirga makkahensis]
MKHFEFRIGGEFTTPAGRWRCTDIGTRTIVAIRVDLVETRTIVDGHPVRRYLAQEEAELEGWLNGPPYTIPEQVFDEDAIAECEPVQSGE